MKCNKTTRNRLSLLICWTLSFNVLPPGVWEKGIISQNLNFVRRRRIPPPIECLPKFNKNKHQEYFNNFPFCGRHRNRNKKNLRQVSTRKFLLSLTCVRMFREEETKCETYAETIFETYRSEWKITESIVLEIYLHQETCVHVQNSLVALWYFGRSCFSCSKLSLNQICWPESEMQLTLPKYFCCFDDRRNGGRSEMGVDLQVTFEVKWFLRVLNLTKSFKSYRNFM